MELKLNKPICFFVETTGIDVGKDRIVEISYSKFFQTETKKVKRG
jgi:DNA polymerase-3 subunit epsilon